MSTSGAAVVLRCESSTVRMRRRGIDGRRELIKGQKKADLGDFRTKPEKWYWFTLVDMSSSGMV